MIVEHALLPVKAGQEVEFESAFGQARTIIAQMHGFRSLTISRCIERPDTYLLLVEWDRLEDHTEGFRGSAHTSSGANCFTTSTTRFRSSSITRWSTRRRSAAPQAGVRRAQPSLPGGVASGSGLGQLEDGVIGRDPA